MPIEFLCPFAVIKRFGFKSRVGAHRKLAIRAYAKEGFKPEPVLVSIAGVCFGVLDKPFMQKLFKLNGIPFDIQPRPAFVPKRSIGSSFLSRF